MKKAAVFFSTIVFDQTLKFLALKNLLPALGGFLVFSCNPNISWSILISSFIFWTVWILAIVFVTYLILKTKNNFFLYFVLAGSFSNIIDRFIHGCVIDYIKIFSFPIFNLADATITAGFILFLYSNKKS